MNLYFLQPSLFLFFPFFDYYYFLSLISLNSSHCTTSSSPSWDEHIVPSKYKMQASWLTLHSISLTFSTVSRTKYMLNAVDYVLFYWLEAHSLSFFSNSLITHKTLLILTILNCPETKTKALHHCGNSITYYFHPPTSSGAKQTHKPLLEWYTKGSLSSLDRSCQGRLTPFM